MDITKNNQKILSNLKKIFLSKTIIKNIYSFLNNQSLKELKAFAQKNYSLKERKKQILDFLSKYCIETGKHSELIKYRIIEGNKIIFTTNIFNLHKGFVQSLDKTKYDEEILNMEKTDFFKFLKIYSKPYFYLTNNKDSMKLCKALIPYDAIEDDTIEEDENEEKYSMFYKDDDISKNFNDINLTDYSKESLIERQKKIIEMMNAKKEDFFYPLKFINSVNHWTIILCHGGYFACGFFYKDKLLEHKSDHKYVVRAKAGQRQIVKDNKKSTKNSVGAQLRREGEKKHQENIEFILKLNETLLQKSECIYIFAPGLNKNILIGSNEKTLFSFKNKILSIPFNVSRANYTHMIEIYNKLTTVSIETEFNI